MSEAGHYGLQQAHVLLVPVEGLLQDLEGLGHQQAHLARILADQAQHQEGARLEGGVVVEGSPAQKGTDNSNVQWLHSRLPRP